ncbi:MAG: hypothetical protein ACJASB_001808 [Shewanella psychromarinicola]|jgi:hypothetical protein
MNNLPLAFRTSKIIALVLCSIIVMTGCGSGSGEQISDPLPTRPTTGQVGDGNLEQIVEYIRINEGLPALAAVLVHDGQIIEMAATGSRAINTCTSGSVRLPSTQNGHDHIKRYATKPLAWSL